MLDSWLFRAEVSLIVGALVVLVLGALIAVCNGRAGMPVSALPIWAGLGVRLGAVAVAAAFPAIGRKLTSTDEAAFLATTHALAARPLTDGSWLSMTFHWTEVVPWALTFKVFGNCGVLPLRLEQIGFSLAAVVIVSGTASKIGGPRAGLIAAWVAALEPSTIYFSGLLHQESLCMLGEALLLAALVDAWTRLRARDRFTCKTVCLALAGLALIFGTRSYMAFFAGVAVVLVVLGAALCRRLGISRGLVVLGAGALLLAAAGIIAAPHVVPHSLAGLQHQLDFDYVGANLPLGRTDVLTSTGLGKTVVLRGLDLILRPYPWQLGSTSQQVAVAGTLLWYAMLIVTAGLALRVGFDERLVPVLILFLCETVGFALTLVDAGEGFRHRINLILMLAVVLAVLADRLLPARSPSPLRHQMGRVPARRVRSRPARGAIVAAAAALGPVIALSIALALPVRYRATVTLALPKAARVHVPAGPAFTAQAQLYGALGPGMASATLSFSATRPTPAPARAWATGAAPGGHSHAEATLRSHTTIPPSVVAKSPRTLRDALLGLLAGLLIGVVSVLLTRPAPAARSAPSTRPVPTG
jgi:hypothetical protein